MDTNLFKTSPGGIILPADAKNEAGGAAYARGPEESLAQFAATGCFGNTYYVTAEDQLKQVLEIAGKCSDEWIAKCALYSRAEGQMKDMPAVLCALLAKRNVPLLAKVFARCIDNGKMLRNFVQVVRSGVTGRKSFGTAVRRLVRQWFDKRTDEELFHASIGEKPSLGDIVRMVHPKPTTEGRRMTFAYLMGKEVAALGQLPEVVQQFEAFKKGAGEPPNINFQFLSSLTLTDAQWGSICDRASWQTLRMNLNTFARHKCFEDTARLSRVIERLRDKVEIGKVRPMPYQLYAAYMHVADELPPGIKQALAQAVELSLDSIPALPPNTVVAVDVSGSMSSALTGARAATSKVRCVDVAALFACAILRKCPTARVLAFDTSLYQTSLAGSVIDSAKILASHGGGGTNCSLPLMWCASNPKQVDAVVLISDNESWVDRGSYGTASMEAWRRVQRKFPKAKLACIDLTPNTTRQTCNEPSILNVGGFNDTVFDVLGSFLGQSIEWTSVIGAVDIDKAV